MGVPCEERSAVPQSCGGIAVHRQRVAFVVRIWLEPDNSGQTPRLLVRGSLQAVDSDERHYFSSFDELPRIIRALTGWSDQSGTAHSGKEENSAE